MPKFLQSDNINRKQLFYIVSFVVMISSITISVTSYLDARFFLQESFNKYEKEQNEQYAKDRKNNTRQMNVIVKNLKQVQINNLIFRKKFLLSIPPTQRTDRDDMELNLINIELDILNAN